MRAKMASAMMASARKIPLISKMMISGQRKQRLKTVRKQLKDVLDAMTQCRLRAKKALSSLRLKQNNAGQPRVITSGDHVAKGNDEAKRETRRD